jgi:hypothetical protein
MKARITLAGVSLRAAVILGLVFSLAPAAGAQMPAVKAKASPAKAQIATAAKPSGGTQEGIQVHGHWTIVVRDADGKEVTRREFDNALLDEGKGVLALLLAKQFALQEWAIQLSDVNGGPCGVIFEPNSTQGGGIPGISKTLTVTSNLVPGNANARTVQLKGDTRALVVCDIARVDTAVYSAQGTAGFFTRANLQPAITVAVNRFIEVTVVLSFS